MKNYQYILLDWDGNLARTLDIWLDAFRVVLNNRGFYPSDQEIAASFGGLSTYLVSLGATDAHEAYLEADKIARQTLPDVELYPDALNVLLRLHRLNKQLALITTTSRKNVVETLTKHGMHQLFSVIVAGDDVTHHKPHPEPLERGLELLNGQKDLAVMIGDSDKDISAANNFGIDSILFYPPEHRKFYDLEVLKSLKPTYVVDDFRKVIDIVTDLPEASA